MIKGCFLFSYVVLTLAISCGQGVGPRTFSPKTLQVIPASSSEDCTVNQDSVDLYADSHQGANTIRWCVDPTVSTQYYIHFTNNSGHDSPLQTSAGNDIHVNVHPNAVANLTCSDLQTSDSTKPHNNRPYKYEVHVGDPHSGAMTPTTCADPKVILK